MAACRMPTGISAYRHSSYAQCVGCRHCGSWGALHLKPSKMHCVLQYGSGVGVKSLRVEAQAKNSARNEAESKSARQVRLFPEPLRTFPWQQVATRFGTRILDLLWTSCGWLLLPMVAVSAMSEVAYTLSHHKEFLVPMGLVVGSALAGIIRETAMDFYAHLQDSAVPWDLVFCFVIFSLIKLPSPNYPYLARCLIPHIGTGGLWQAWLYLRAWRKERHGAAATESSRA